MNMKSFQRVQTKQRTAFLPSPQAETETETAPAPAVTDFTPCLPNSQPTITAPSVEVAHPEPVLVTEYELRVKDLRQLLWYLEAAIEMATAHAVARRAGKEPAGYLSWTDFRDNLLVAYNDAQFHLAEIEAAAETD